MMGENSHDTQYKRVLAYVKQSQARQPRTKSSQEPSSGGWWTGSSSSSDTSDCSSASEAGDSAEWEKHVDSKGEVMYIVPQRSKRPNPLRTKQSQGNDGKSSPGLLGRLIRRKSTRQSFRRKDSNSRDSGRIFNFSDIQDGEFYEVSVLADPGAISSGRSRAPLLESLLGVVSQTSSDGRITVKGFTPAFAQIYEDSVAVGDWLVSVDGVLVSRGSLDPYLASITVPRHVLLRFKTPRVHHLGEPSAASSPTDQLSLVYCKLSDLSETDPMSSVAYSFPPSCILSQSPGIYLTLHQLWPRLAAGANPLSTLVRLEDSLTHVFYGQEQAEHVSLLAFPASKFNRDEGQEVLNTLLISLLFSFQTLPRALEDPSCRAGLEEHLWKAASRLTPESRDSFLLVFPGNLPLSSRLPLPSDLESQLGDALNELEANSVHGSGGPRLYTILGSCFFHKGLLAASHLSVEDTADVACLLDMLGMSQLSKQGLEELVLWRQVYPASVARGLATPSLHPYSPPTGRWFLLVVAQEEDMLCVLLESGGCTVEFDEDQPVGPDPNYVAEAFATLEHISTLGISKAYSKWLNWNARLGSRLTLEAPPAQETPSSSHSRFSHSLPSVYKLNDSMRKLRDRSGPDLLHGTLNHRDLSDSDVSEDSREARSADGATTMLESARSWPTLDRAGMRLPPATTLLFHYLSLEPAQGVFICGKCNAQKPSDELLEQFNRSAKKIHSVLRHSVSFKEMKPGTWPVNKCLVAVKEYGLLVDATPPSLPGLWVIGRLFLTPQPRELFVAHQDSCPQSLVELAFRLAARIS